MMQCECKSSPIFRLMSAAEIIGDGSDRLTFCEAQQHAPPGCHLATISSAEDLLQLRATKETSSLPSSVRNNRLWTGITKDYADVVEDGSVDAGVCCDSSGSQEDYCPGEEDEGDEILPEDLRCGWKNVDGSPLYDSANDHSDEPAGPWKNDDDCTGFVNNNFPRNFNSDNRMNTNAVWENQGLRDTDPSGTQWSTGVVGAIYKCCYETSCFDGDYIPPVVQ